MVREPGRRDARARSALRALGLGRVGAMSVVEENASNRALVRRAGKFVTDRRVS